MNYTQLLASDPVYIFYVLLVSQQVNLSGRIIKALKKVCASNLTPVMILHNFPERVRAFIAKDNAYEFMITITVTPAY